MRDSPPGMVESFASLRNFVKLHGLPFPVSAT